MEIQVWVGDSDQGVQNQKIYSRPATMNEALADIKKAQLEWGGGKRLDFTVEFAGVQDGDV